MNPLISVIIPSYNSEEYLSTTLKSVKKQSYDNWECLIIDDGSTDNTKSIIKHFIDTDNRFKYYYKENTGLSDTRNYGLNLANGNFIQFLDSDDVLYVDKLKLTIDHYLGNKDNFKIFFTDFEFTLDNNPYEKNHLIRKLYSDIKKIGVIDFKKMYTEWDWKFIIPTHAFLFPIEIFKNLKYDKSLQSKEDWDFYLSILSNKDIRFESIDYIGCGYRVRTNSMSQNYDKMILSTFFVLNKWKFDSTIYRKRLAQYLIDVYIKKIKGSLSSVKLIISKLRIQKTVSLIDFIIAHLYLPYFLIIKTLKKIKL